MVRIPELDMWEIVERVNDLPPDLRTTYIADMSSTMEERLEVFEQIAEKRNEQQSQP